jgi:hypothetical protein
VNLTEFERKVETRSPREQQAIGRCANERRLAATDPRGELVAQSTANHLYAQCKLQPANICADNYDVS